VFFAARVNIILFMRRKTFFLIVLMVALAACAPAARLDNTVGSPAATVAVPPSETTPLPDIATATATILAAIQSAVTTTPAHTPLVETPTASIEVLPTSTPTEVAITFGRTEEGAYYHGAVDAPVTLIDYSDFL
jgi:hypothetical protein